jgi:hypothetical protein
MAGNQGERNHTVVMAGNQGEQNQGEQYQGKGHERSASAHGA